MKAIILAGGKGSRLNSAEADMPKVLREVNGKPLIQHVLDKLTFLNEEDIYIVIGYKGDMIKERLKGNYSYVLQKEQLGTGHAVMVCEESFKDYRGDVLVMYGDMPLFKEETYKALIKAQQMSEGECTLLSAIDSNPPAYGRLIRDDNGELRDIVETKDCTEEQLMIKEINVGMYVFKSPEVFESLKAIKNDNAQNEYYLTDVPKVVLSKGEKVSTYTIEESYEYVGVNTIEDLQLCEKVI